MTSPIGSGEGRSQDRVLGSRPMELEGRAAIVTGGAGGLGAATVRRLVEQGVGVAVFDRDLDRAHGPGRRARRRGRRGGRRRQRRRRGRRGHRRRAGRSAPLSLVVNVAGGGVGGGRTVGRDGTPHDKDAFTATMDMNAVGTFNVTRLAAAAMAANEPDERRPARRGRQHRARSPASRARPASSPTAPPRRPSSA